MATCPTCKTTYPDTMRLCPTDGAVLEGGPPPKDDNVGRTLDGKYRLDQRLSSGGMGTVYKATHLMLDKPVAVKLIKADLPASPEVVKRFQREARAASALNHPNIVPAYDLGQTPDGTLYIAMEYLDGRSLKEVIQAGPVAPARIIRILRQVASALALAHKHEIIHRDLKPQNIMLTTDGEGHEVAKLLDFGIAKTLDDPGTQLTATGFSLGTPQYMSPEQAYGRPVDGRSDLYSLGIILYEMLIGEVPFSDPSMPAILVKQMTEAPVPPQTRRPDLQVSPELAAIAMRCLEKDPANRYQTADDVIAALDAASSALATTAVAVPSAPAAGLAAAAIAATPTMTVGHDPVPQTTRMSTPAPLASPAAPTALRTPPPVATPSAVAETARTPAPTPTPAVAPTAATMPPPAPPSPAPAAAAVAPTPPAPAPTPARGGGSGRVAVAAAIAILLLGGAAFGAYRMGLIGSTASSTSATTAPAASAAQPNLASAAPPASGSAAGSSDSSGTGGGAPPTPASPPPGAPSGGDGSAAASVPVTPPPTGTTTPPASMPGASPKPPVTGAKTAAPASTPAGAAVSSPAVSSPAGPPPAPAVKASAPQGPAPADQAPVNPAVAFRCDGPPDVCGAIKSALDQTLAKEGMTGVRDPARADVAVGATVTLVDAQTQQMFGTTFTIRNYTIEVEGEGRRGETVAMPGSTTFAYDARYRDRLDEKARLVATSVVDSIRKYWAKR